MFYYQQFKIISIEKNLFKKCVRSSESEWNEKGVWRVWSFVCIRRRNLFNWWYTLFI